MRATLPLGVIILGLLACGEPTGVSVPVVPAYPMSTVAVLRGTIDLDRGTLDFAPVIRGGALPGFSPAIYGDQNVNVRLYNSPVVVDSSTSTWRWTANVGVRNMRPHPVGDEESTTPADTIGVFVFFVQEPILSQPCSGCFARIANFQGTMSFDAPQRKYFHWAEQLNEINSPAGDTTRSRRTWTFETSAGVRSFTFSVLVAAAWPSPYETRWRVEYTADAMPDSAAPAWKLQGAGGNASVSGGSLLLRGNFSGLFYRRDPIAPAQSAYMHAIVRRSGGGSAPDVGLILSDRVKLMAVGVANGLVGLISNAGTFLAGTTSPLVNGTHEVQLRKYGADSIVYFVDGARRGAASYASLPADALSPPLSSVSFGGLPMSAGSNSTWESVIYEIGVSAP